MIRKYIVDASSWSELVRRYPAGKYPGIETGAKALMGSGRVCSPYEVFNELCNNVGLKDWARAHKSVFRHPVQQEVAIITEILKKHPECATLNRPYDADPWLGAFALAHARDQQGLLIAAEKSFVVSEDSKAVKHICSSFGLEQMTLFDLLVAEGIVSVPAAKAVP